MMPNRNSRPPYTSGQSSGIRKSRLDNKPSMLPVPYRGSTDRTSSDARRPSGARSSSAEPPRGFGGAHSSRDTSATKLSTNRARSQTSEHRYGHMATPTPQRGSQYSRTTTTPSRTPDDRSSRSWENCLERVLAFVTIKDPRCISNVAWQRAEYARVCTELSARNSGNAALVRPLTIARFVDIVAELLNAIIGEPKLSTDNYVTKLPHLAKRLLYPSPVSKSWLKTVNTLHAFPQALALIGYLLDVANHCEDAVVLDHLYLTNDDLSCLRRSYIMQCWIRFQQPEGSKFDDLKVEYLRTLRETTGHDDDQIQKLRLEIKEYERGLEDAEEMAARADEARRVARRDELMDELRRVRAERCAVAADIDAQDAAARALAEGLEQQDAEIERTSAELGQMRVELEQQPMSVEERAKLLDQVDYATRVHDSKRALADQINKMVVSKETELAQWQKRTLDVCVEYKQGLIQLSAQLPALAGLAIDEKELMGAQCAEHMATAVERLRAEGATLAARKAELQRSRSALSRQRAALMEEYRAKIADLKQKIPRTQQATQEEHAQEAAEAAAWRLEQQQAAARLEQLRANQAQYAKVDAELQYCQEQDAIWRKKLEELSAHVAAQRREAQERLKAVKARREAEVLAIIATWREQLNGGQ